MLAQNFMRPEALGISDKEFEALVKVLGMLDRKEIAPEDFRMDVVRCGTAACLKGWCQTVSLDRDMFYGCWDDRSSTCRPAGLNRLFGYAGSATSQNPTRSQAAIALRNYLMTGEPRWSEVLAA
jgi:hypothetical protein